MRYSQESSASSLALDPPQQPQLLHLFPPHNLAANTPYVQDGASYYQPHSQLPFGAVDVRARLGSHPAPHRSAIAHPVHSISTREQYSQATPSFRRPAEHLSRSPPFPGESLRRNPLSPSATSVPGFAVPSGRMEAQYSNRTPASSVPPLGPTQSLGTLNYVDGSMTPVKAEIAGSIDKGFFIAEGEWTCYRRNYFACLCSYTLSPHYPSSPLNFTPSDSAQLQPLQVLGFSMSISAVVADNDHQSIDLVQHTPKRDKGPVSKPEKVPLLPKQSSSHHPLSVYADGSGMVGARGIYGEAVAGPQSNGQGPQCEHTFERIQFKQATQNNGKRRAAQQYYHLVVELWADVGSQRSEKYVKVAYRKSAKMIVRGRSPGHYQNDRRSSHSSGPGGSTGGMGYSGLSPMGDFTSNALLGGGTGYAGGYDARGSIYGMRHHDIPDEPIVPAEAEKAMEEPKPYFYYPSPVYESAPRQVDSFPAPQHQAAVVKGHDDDSNNGNDCANGCEGGSSTRSNRISDVNNDSDSKMTTDSDEGAESRHLFPAPPLMAKGHSGGFFQAFFTSPIKEALAEQSASRNDTLGRCVGSS